MTVMLGHLVQGQPLAAWRAGRHVADRLASLNTHDITTDLLHQDLCEPHDLGAAGPVVRVLVPAPADQALQEKSKGKSSTTCQMTQRQSS